MEKRLDPESQEQSADPEEHRNPNDAESQEGELMIVRHVLPCFVGGRREDTSGKMTGTIDCTNHTEDGRDD